MLEFLNIFFTPLAYIPHGHCYLWQTPLVALHLVSDALIAIAYFSIPTMLIYFIYKRRDIAFSSIFAMFGAFIVLCGVGHLLDIWTLWHPDYWVSGIERAITALVSCYTALRLVELLPQFLSLRTPEQLEAVNQKLQKEVLQRQRTEEILQALVSGTASVTGQDFFPALVKNLAKALNVKYVIVSEKSHTQDQTLDSLGFWAGDNLGNNFNYEFTGRPCDFITYNHEFACYPEKLREHFPNDPLLEAIEAESYLGVSLLDGNQRAIGNLCILDVKPLEEQDQARAIMSVFAARAATELQRKWAEEEKRLAYEELEFRVEKRTAELVAVNSTLETEIQERIDIEAELRVMAEREKTISLIIQRMRESLNLETIFQATTNALRQAVDCDRVVIYRFNPDWSGALVSESVSTGWDELLPEQADDPILTQATTDAPGCVLTQMNSSNFLIKDTYLQEQQGGIYRKKQTFCSVSDIYQAGFSSCYLEFLEQLSARAYVIAPIFSGNTLWGLLGVYQNSGPRDWKEAQVKIVTQIGNQLGVAVQQAELFAQTQKQAEELHRTAEAANTANRAKSEFLANMSHELRTPLNAILGFTQLMQRDSSLADLHQGYIDIINKSGSHLLALINDVLEMSKIEAGRVTLNEVEFDLPKLVYSLESMLQLKAKSKGLSLRFELQPTLLQFIRGDENKLRQVLINLLGNAIKFTNQGRVTLRISSSEFNPDIETPHQAIVQFEVEDTGPGLSSEDIKGLFQAFQQTRVGRQSQEGTGLGLRISQKFVQLMGGLITVTSTVGEGSRFKFEIPVGLVQGSQMENTCDLNGAIRLAPGQPSYRILVVEDNPINRLLLVTLLKDIGVEVQEAENGEVAIAAWQQWHPHLIFMDMHMPKMDGYEATQRIKQWKTRTHPSSDLPPIPPIIAITASAFSENREECLQVGCDSFVSKPFRREEILDTLSQYLGAKYSYQEMKNTPTRPSSHDKEPDCQLEADALNFMPADWVQQFYNAVAQGSDTLALELLSFIPSEYSELIETLTNLLENYQFDRLMELAQPNSPTLSS
ncbi:GAF domain-containing hybrid sensor histidine kinase/response regulator [Oscillatoria acuminata]|uniref:Circadian input-output histidine kinase CikA n=1 Tax=Oscillatoria acuminata PCC 6304 TaxID=56110 RepID=K9TMR4_9CYAN|nr:GAF domain-containing hybrid sensor histidine kinase/response regulator [Oscillatoria acuminata]AFY83703.1 signal transduction histidine kinase [Oscillatoria acuminata PCC 6304]